MVDIVVAQKEAAVQEVMGIVISRGRRPEPEPRFSMYIWGPAPEPDTDATPGTP
jgi:hypothetical protein